MGKKKKEKKQKPYIFFPIFYNHFTFVIYLSLILCEKREKKQNLLAVQCKLQLKDYKSNSSWSTTWWNNDTSLKAGSQCQGLYMIFLMNGTIYGCFFFFFWWMHYIWLFCHRGSVVLIHMQFNISRDYGGLSLSFNLLGTFMQVYSFCSFGCPF